MSIFYVLFMEHQMYVYSLRRRDFELRVDSYSTSSMLRSSLEEWMAVDARVLGLHLPHLLPLSQEPFDLLHLFVVCLVTFWLSFFKGSFSTPLFIFFSVFRWGKWKKLLRSRARIWALQLQIFLTPTTSLIWVEAATVTLWCSMLPMSIQQN